MIRRGGDTHLHGYGDLDWISLGADSANILKNMFCFNIFQKLYPNTKYNKKITLLCDIIAEFSGEFSLNRPPDRLSF